MEVLPRLGPTDLASLACVSHRCAVAAAATALVRWAHDEKDLPGRLLCLEEACARAARGGNLEELKWLHRSGCPWGLLTSGGY